MSREILREDDYRSGRVDPESNLRDHAPGGFNPCAALTLPPDERGGDADHLRAADIRRPSGTNSCPTVRWVYLLSGHRQLHRLGAFEGERLCFRRKLDTYDERPRREASHPQ